MLRSEAFEAFGCGPQSWQAAAFYDHLGYEEFTRFEHFPEGHERIGFRRYLK